MWKYRGGGPDGPRYITTIDGEIQNRDIKLITDGGEWTSVSTLPYSFYRGCAIVYDNEIHILGGYTINNDNELIKHYKWNGSTWTNVSTLPYNFYYGSVVVYNNEIHILGGYNNGTKHYKWDGSTWTSVNLPYKFHQGSAVIYNEEIHILGRYNNFTNHYIINKILYEKIE